MFKKLTISLLALSMLLTGISLKPTTITATEKQTLNIAVVTTDENNDLYKTLVANYNGIQKVSTIDAALELNTDDDASNDVKGMMVLADNYPSTTTVISEENAAAIKEAGIRLYIEYPENNTTLGINGYSGSVLMNGYEGGRQYNRGVVTNAEKMGMTNHSILYVLGARLSKKQLTPSSIDTDAHWMVASRVAGYDVAEFGITEATYSLIEVNEDVMIASTKFSQFISARYAPYERYQKFWMSILSWLSGTTVSSIEWTPLMTTSYGPTDSVDMNAYKNAVMMNTEWYIDSGMVLSETDHNVYVNNKSSVIEDDETGENNLTNNGTGIYGILEAFSSGWGFNEDGSQKVRFVRRADCNGESAGNIALAGVLLNNDEYSDIAYNVVNWLLTESILSQGPRADVTSPEYGLLSWDDRSQVTIDAYYGDDNAKAILGLITATSALRTTGNYDADKLDAFDKRILEAILANFRTTSVTGMREARINGPDLRRNGWEYYYEGSITHYAPHYQALNMATYLWAYDKTGYVPLLDRAKAGIRNLMNAYNNNQWNWTNGLQQERAKMILPLAWLVRIEDTAEHRAWLDKIAEDMMRYQDAETGALRDAFGEPGEGVGSFGPFTSNSQYGNHESPVIQKNGDPCVDALYTSSFAMMSLNEAYAATSDATLKAKYKNYSDSLADFFVKCQTTSPNEDYNGVWFRGFDYEKWEVYGSDGDAAWGVWATETGWSQAWISNSLSMKVMNTNIWDYTKNTTVDDCFEETAILMLNYDPNDLVDPTLTSSVKLNNGTDLLIDDVYGSTTWNDGKWTGNEGNDITLIFDLKETKTLGELSLGFINSWSVGIRVPETVVISGSTDGETYTPIGTTGTSNEFVNKNDEIERLTVDANDAKARYIKVEVKNPGKLPSNHHSAGNSSWVFMDEFDWVISQATISDLYEILAITRPLTVGIYTEETGSALKEARDAAESVYAKENPTDAEIHEAYKDLKEAYDNLETSKVVVSMTTSTDGDHKDKLIDREYATELTHQDNAYVGWQNVKTVEAVIDLKEVTGISSVGYSTLSRPTWAIYVPNTTVYVSNNGSDWKEVGTIAAYKHEGDTNLFKTTHPTLELSGTLGRYVKYVWKTDKEWIFIDEVEIETYIPASIIDSTNLNKGNLLVDGEYGLTPSESSSYRNKWAEYEGADVSFTIDLGSEKYFDTVSLGFLNAYSFGICPSEEVKVFVSTDNVTYTEFGTAGVEDAFGLGSTQTIERVKVKSSTNALARYVKVEVKNPGVLPPEHHTPGNKTWMFMDEVEVIDSGANYEAALQEALDSVASIDVNKYTEESAVAFREAKEAVKDLMDADSKDGASVNAVIDALNSAKNNLVAKGIEVIYLSDSIQNGRDKAKLVDYCKATTPNWDISDAYLNFKNLNAGLAEKTFTFVVDLKEETDIFNIGFYNTSRPASGVYTPNAKIYVSDDNVTWEEVGSITGPEHGLANNEFEYHKNFIETDVKGRYVKYELTLPNGREWVFTDELSINDVSVAKENLEALVSEVSTLATSGYGDKANVFKTALSSANALLSKSDVLASEYKDAYDTLKATYDALIDNAYIVYDKTLGKPGANGLYTILDGNLGSTTPDQYNQAFGNGTWTGIEKQDITVTITLPEVVEFNQLSLGFLQEYLWGIRYPEYVTFYISEDGENWSEYDTVTVNKEFSGEDSTSYRVVSDITPASSKYFKIFAKNGGVIGEGHPRVAAGTPTWMFWDEFVYETVVDTRDLVDAISTIEGLDKSLYTSASVETLDTAIIVATAVLADEDATQEEVDAALEALVDAYNALVNISSLKEVVEAVENTDTSKYTETSVKAFEDALKVAKEVLVNGTDEEVEVAEKVLVEAYNALEEKPVEEEAPGTGDTTNVGGLLAMMIAALGVLLISRRKRA